jgi:CheY-like chemotaxis protein
MSIAQKILVADDSLTIRKLVESVLSQDGYEVICAETGADCLAVAAAQKPSLILLDYILPDKQGTEICRQLINSPETWEIPVLMMSSNGNAIRQLYQDLNNVADYLTKPFAPSVLKAVVGHLLQKEQPAPSGETASTTQVPSVPPAPAAEPPMPKEFMDKVTRLIDLMETKPLSENTSPKAEETSAKSEGAAGPGHAALRTKARRSRKSVASVPAAEAMLRKFRLALQKHLRSRMRQIPDWESGRDTQEPEEFYLSRLLTKDVLGDLSAELVRATGMPAEAPGALRCPVGLLPLDVVLRHLHTSRATGELRIETGDETVLVCLDLGQAVFLTTNHPRNYCAGAACDFQSVPHGVISEAIRAQEEQSVPFFITLKNSGHLTADSILTDLLVSQGEKCLVRAFKAADSVISFLPVTRLPAMVRSAKLNVPLHQLLLACYRTVDDWFTLERTLPEMDATFIPTPEFEDQLQQLGLDADEARMVEVVRAGGTVNELSQSTQLKPFEVCRILFRFIKLGLVRQGLRRDHDERVDDDNVAAPLSTSATPSEEPETAVPPAPEVPAEEDSVPDKIAMPESPEGGIPGHPATEDTSSTPAPVPVEPAMAAVEAAPPPTTWTPEATLGPAAEDSVPDKIAMSESPEGGILGQAATEGTSSTPAPVPVEPATAAVEAAPTPATPTPEATLPDAGNGAANQQSAVDASAVPEPVISQT